MTFFYFASYCRVLTIVSSRLGLEQLGQLGEQTLNIHRIYNDNAGRNFSYVIDNGESACAVDPYYAELIISYLQEKGLALVSIVNTHEHHDHTRGNDALLAYADCRVINYSTIHSRKVFDSSPNPPFLEWKKGWFGAIIDTPGHTMKHISIFFFESRNRTIKERAVICGDTIFSAGVGNCHNGGDVEVLQHTLELQFYRMDDNTLIYPGHEYWHSNLNFALSLEPDNQKAREILAQLGDDPAQAPVSTIGLERQVNPFFRLDKLALDGEDEVDTFIRLRSLRDRW